MRNLSVFTDSGTRKQNVNKRASQYSRERFTDEKIFNEARRIGAVDRRYSVAAGFSDEV